MNSSIPNLKRIHLACKAETVHVPVITHYRKPTASPQLAAVLGAVLSKGLNGVVIFLSLFSKCSQRGCVSGSIFAFGVVQFLIGRLATIRKTDWIR
jgi:hypothetical protein